MAPGGPLAEPQLFIVLFFFVVLRSSSPSLSPLSYLCASMKSWVGEGPLSLLFLLAAPGEPASEVEDSPSSLLFLFLPGWGADGAPLSLVSSAFFFLFFWVFTS